MNIQILKCMVICIICALPLKAKCQGNPKYMNIVMSDNSCISYELSTDYSIYAEFSDSTMTIQYVEFYLKNIIKYFFSSENHATSISNISSEQPIIRGKKLYVTTPNGGYVRLFTLDGKMVMTQKIDNSEMVIDLNHLSKNIYILKINETTAKFVIQ